MLNRLISNLPFNPSLVEEFSFYTNRLKKEASVRRLGVIMIILSMLVQIFALSFPAEKSLAASSNDIVEGGVKTKAELLQKWDNPRTQVAVIYKKFGVTRDDIARMPNKPVTIKSNGSNYWSIGRHSLSGYADINSNYKRQEIAIKTEGPTVYMKPLKAWDTRVPYSTYKAFQGRNSTTGEKFWILIDCANYVQNGKGSPPPPQLEVKKTIVGKKSQVKAGDTVKFRIEYRNKKEDSLAEDVKIIDKLQRNKFEVVSPKNLPIGRDDTLEKNVGNLHYTKNSKILDITVRVKNNLKAGTKICNSVRLTAANAPAVSGGGAPKTCVEVVAPEQAKEKTTVTTTQTEEEPQEDIPETDIPPGLSKEVKNITQNLSGNEAINATVKAGDVIEYSLLTYNSKDSEINNYQIDDYIGDILEYADLDTAFLSQQGGTYNESTKSVVWANQKLTPKEDNVRVFRVKMKNPIPSTNTPTTASTAFDCKISNEYGNEVSMTVACPTLKTIETLPNTGPGTAIAITFGLTSFSGYFLARNRLVNKELFILRKNYASSGE